MPAAFLFHHLNELEIALVAAAQNADGASAFNRVLMSSNVFIEGWEDSITEPGMSTLPAGSSLRIQDWAFPDGSTFIPFYTSLRSLNLHISQGSQYLCLPARALFEITRGAKLVLNPRDMLSIEFEPALIAQLLLEDSN